MGGQVGDPCQICTSAPSKYRCPSCARLTCSLGCVARHKTGDGCTGRRIHAARTFVPAAALTPDVLADDYWLLEDAQALASRLSRSQAGASKRVRLRALEQAAGGAGRAVRLDLMPAEMSRAKRNRSRLFEGCIVWTVEWIVLGALPEHPANMTLDQLRPCVRHTCYTQCREGESVEAGYADLQCHHPELQLPAPCEAALFLRLEVDSQPTIAPVDIAPARRLWPVRSPAIVWTALLAHRTVVEFPTIYISGGQLSAGVCS